LTFRFSANVNSCSGSSERELLPIRPSVMLVCPDQAVEIFCNISTAFGTLAIRENFTEVVPGEHLCRGS